MAKQRSVATKFILTVSVITLVLMIALAAMVIATAGKSQSSQAEGFIATLKAEQTQEEQLLRDGLVRKGESLIALLSQTAGSLIVGYDFDNLQRLAQSTVNDSDIVGVVFYNPDGDVIAKVQSEDQNTETLKKEILLENEPAGYVEITLSMASVRKNIDKLSNRITSLAAETNEAMTASAWGLGWRILITAGATLLILCLVIYWCLSRFVIKPVNHISQGLDGSANQVTAEAAQLSVASLSLSEGAAEQAASMEETSASLEEVSSMTKQNSQNATQCDTLMKEVNGVVKKANDSMTEQTAAMAEITKASEETSKIIKTIDEIAFQTNLLALNAAVEAARAGEAGAGFAVVADEVRNLAMRAAEAAKDTETLIEGTVKKVQEGEGLVVKTNEAFSEVAEKAAKVGSLVSEIAAASNEQTRGIEQVNKAIAEIDHVTQRTASSAEECAGSSEELNSHAGLMKQYVEELVVLVKGDGTGARSQAVAGSLSSGNTAGFVKKDPANDVVCWEVKNCPEDRRNDCPAHPHHGSKCWVVPGTCGGKIQGSYHEKINNCKKCEVYIQIQAKGGTLSKSSEPPRLPAAETAITPEQIIPMDDDEFENF